ncbi:MAG: FlgD immunoglobulin-like domain containing protein, partial [Calditrichia bacterium]
GTSGLQIAYDQVYVHNSLSIRIIQDAEWLTEYPVSGIVPPGGSMKVSVAVDTAGLLQDRTRAEILVYSNDPLNPLLVLPVVRRADFGIFQNVAVGGGWNLLGIPLRVLDPWYRSVFPSVVPNSMYGFNGNYFQTEILNAGSGYWMRFSAGDTAMVQGHPFEMLPVQLKKGWDLISGGSCPLAFSEIEDPGMILVSGTLFGFEGHYQAEDTLQPGKGYWVRADTAGVITFNCSPSRLPAKRAALKTDLSQVPNLRVRDAVGNEQVLYFQVELHADESVLNYSLPPLPPAGAFDARFSSDLRICRSGEAEIRVQSAAYPLEICPANLPPSQSAYVLKEFLPQGKGRSHLLSEGNSIIISNPLVTRLSLEKETTLPLSFRLHQNYPNPFNPATTIRYELPERSRVSLVIYNLLGQEVRRLVSGDIAAGYHSAKWDGRNNAGVQAGSGVYIFRFRAGDYQKVMKMILMK